MQVDIRELRKDGESCNFCKRGTLNHYGFGLNYPYDYTYLFGGEGAGLKAAICDKCLNELYKKAKELKKILKP